MRLAVFTNQFPSRVSTFFARDMRALIEAGIEIDIYPIYSLNHDLWKFVPSLLDEEVFPRDQVKNIGLLKSFLPLMKVNKRLSRFLRDAAAINFSAAKYGIIPVMKSIYVCIKSLGWANQTSFDYDHVLAYWGNYSATCAYLYQRLVDVSIPFSFFLHAGTDLYRDQVFLREKLISADNVFVVCDFNRRYIQQLYPDIYQRISGKIHLYHLGLDLESFRFQPDSRPSGRILGVGNLAERKGFHYLLLAIQKLIRRGMNIQVDLIGDGRQAGNLKSLAKKLQINHHVHFHGWLPFDKVRSAMSDSTILVHPSTGLGDAVPTVIKEAMALGTPVVASDVAGIPELLDEGRCGELVPPRDVDRLAEATGKLLANEELRMHYAKVARKRAEILFDLWENGKKLANILRDTKPRNNYGLPSL